MIRTFLLSLLFCLSLTASAQSAPTAAELKLQIQQQQLENQELRLQNMASDIDRSKENLADKIDAYEKRVAGAEKAVSDEISLLNTYVTIVSVIIALFGIGISCFIAYRFKSLKTEFNESSRSLKTEIETLKAEARTKIDEMIVEAENIMKKLREYENRGKTLVDKIAEDATKGKKLTGEQEKELITAVNKIEKEKTENEYTANNWFILGVQAVNEKRYEDACYYNKKAIEIDPYFLDAYNNLGNALRALAKENNDERLFNEAIEKYEEAIKIENNQTLLFEIGLIYEELARLTNDESYYKKAITSYERSQTKDHHPGLLIARVYCRFLNDNDSALRWIEKFYTEEPVGRDGNKYPDRKYLMNEQAFANLHSDERFKELLDKYLPKDSEEEEELV